MAQADSDQTEERNHLARAVGERIAACRKAARVDQRELARCLGVKAPTMNRWETGYTPISVYDLRRVAQALRMPASWFLDVETMEAAEVRDLQWQQSFRRLTPEHQSVLIALLHELLKLQDEPSDGRS